MFKQTIPRDQSHGIFSLYYPLSITPIENKSGLLALPPFCPEKPAVAEAEYGRKTYMMHG
jgi:hypothetical protein